jgi:hypothetical protein
MFYAIAAAALLPLAGAVAADNDQYGKEKDKSMMPDANFKKLDANGDGRISQAEAAADSSIVFTSADANGDGYLDGAEWKASHKGRSGNPSPQSVPSTPHQDQVVRPEGTPPSEETAPPSDATTPPPDTETPRQ